MLYDGKLVAQSELLNEVSHKAGCQVTAQGLTCGGVQEMLMFPFKASRCSRAQSFLPAADAFSFSCIYLSRPSVL